MNDPGSEERSRDCENTSNRLRIFLRRGSGDIRGRKWEVFLIRLIYFLAGMVLGSSLIIWWGR